MTCKDCLYHPKCYDFGIDDECSLMCNPENECKDFKDKSRFIDTGDTIYQIDSERIYKSQIKKIVFITDGIDFDERAIGKSVFLNMTDAEQALKEREK